MVSRLRKQQDAGRNTTSLEAETGTSGASNHLLLKATNGVPRPNGEDASGGSGNGRGGDGTGKRLEFKTKADPFLYPYIKSVFQVATRTFYRAVGLDDAVSRDHLQAVTNPHTLL